MTPAPLATLAYVPLKLGYATVGLVAGGVGWVLSGGDRQVAEAIILADESYRS